MRSTLKNRSETVKLPKIKRDKRHSYSLDNPLGQMQEKLLYGNNGAVREKIRALSNKGSKYRLKRGNSTGRYSQRSTPHERGERTRFPRAKKTSSPTKVAPIRIENSDSIDPRLNLEQLGRFSDLSGETERLKYQISMKSSVPNLDSYLEQDINRNDSINGIDIPAEMGLVSRQNLIKQDHHMGEPLETGIDNEILNSTTPKRSPSKARNPVRQRGSKKGKPKVNRSYGSNIEIENPLITQPPMPPARQSENPYINPKNRTKKTTQSHNPV
jgi:hypothetical protein